MDETHLAFTTCDRLAIWDGGCYEQCRDMYDFLKVHFQDTYTIPAHILEPYYFMSNPKYKFPELFHDKKILIVTSHADSVSHQIQHNLYEIFFPYKIFPEKQNIQVYRTTQQYGKTCDGKDWSIHFEKMCHDLRQLDFDVAFIGCGGFSNILGYYIRYNMNKSAIYVGGPLQIYFGVMGRRWLWNKKVIDHVQRNHQNWIQPLKSDYVKGCETVEESCYWM